MIYLFTNENHLHKNKTHLFEKKETHLHERKHQGFGETHQSECV
jgi:hypothetical protein